MSNERTSAFGDWAGRLERADCSRAFTKGQRRDIAALLRRGERLEAALREHERFIREEYLKWRGPCEHDVGVCYCLEDRMFDRARAALAEPAGDGPGNSEEG